jgi:hypothetical protein
MYKTCIAAEFVCDNQNESAIKSLQEKLDAPGVKLLSLLLRKQRQFENEQTLIQAYAEEYSDDTYIQERHQWHKQPLFDKLVPRQPLHLPCDPMWLPKQETLDQLCIVTGGDAKYFDFIVECIESVKTTNLYKNTPICILDFGLTEQNIADLKKNFNAKIIKPELDIDAPYQIHIKQNQQNQLIFEQSAWESEDAKKVIKFCAYKTCCPTIIPGYRYYLWIDADAWVQDGRALDRYIVLCERQGAAGSCHGSITFGNQFKINSKNCGAIPIAHPEQLEYMFDRHAITDGTFCIDAESEVSKNWFSTYKDLLSCYGFHWHHQEFCLTYLCHKYGAAENVKFPYGFHSGHEGFPVVCAADDILRRPSTLEPVGIPHLVGSSKQLHLIPTQQVVAPLNPQQVQQHKQLTGHWFRHPHQKIIPNQVTTSIRFRVWPWNVSEVNRELHAFAKEVLCRA